MLLAAESLKQLTPKRQSAGSTALPGSLYLLLSLSCLSPLSVWMSLCRDAANLIFLFFCPFSFSISPYNKSSSPHLTSPNLTLPLLCLSACLSVSLSLSVFRSLCLSLPIYLSLCLSLSPYLSLFLSISVSLSLSLYLCLSVSLSLFLSLSLYLCFSMGL